MTMVGFNFTKLIAQKAAPVKGKININNNIAVSSISDSKMAVTAGKQALRIKFAFEARYEPNIGILHFEGDVILLEDPKVSKSILDEWEKKKSLPQKLLEPLFSNIIDRCNMQALIMARDIGLPPPIRLMPPKLNINQQPAKEAPKKAAKKAKK